MNISTSPCTVDSFLESASESDRTALRPLADLLGLRYAFPTHEAGASGGLEVSFLSPRHLVPVRQLAGGRWDIRIIPLALVLTMALREEPVGLEVQIELYESSPVVLRWAGKTLAAVVEDKAFQLLMSTCGFAGSVPELSSRPGFRAMG